MDSCVGLSNWCDFKKSESDISREPSKREMVEALQRECHMQFPQTEEDWAHVPRMAVQIRRSAVLQDSLKAVRKKRFDSSKLLEVTRSFLSQQLYS